MSEPWTCPRCQTDTHNPDTTELACGCTRARCPHCGGVMEQHETFCIPEVVHP